MCLCQNRLKHKWNVAHHREWRLWIRSEKTVWTVRIKGIWLDRYRNVIRTATVNADQISFVGRIIDLFNWVTTVIAPYTYTLECIWQTLISQTLISGRRWFRIIVSNTFFGTSKLELTPGSFSVTVNLTYSDQSQYRYQRCSNLYERGTRRTCFNQKSRR